MHVSQLFYYPVKSLAGIAVEQLEMDAFGALNDRRYMLVDAAGKFITQRQVAKLALIDVQLSDDGLGYRISIPQQGSFYLPVKGACEQLCDVEVWGDHLQAYVQPDWTASFSSYIGQDVRLVYLAESSERLIDANFVVEARKVSFADGFPLLVCTQASLDELNSLLDVPIGMERFRPNIVIAGSAAFAERHWQSLAIDTLQLDLVKPCSRCAIPTINPIDATFQAEVWQALEACCGARDGRIYFGQNAIHQTLSGSIRIASEVVVNA